MGWLGRLISRLTGRKTEAPRALTAADVRKARLTLEQGRQRLGGRGCYP